MSFRTRTNRIGEMFDVFGSAVAVAAAMRTGRKPVASDLRTLGIDPLQFSGIQQNRFSVRED